MNIISLNQYNLNSTLMGGQAFNWDLVDQTYVGFTKDKIVKLNIISTNNFNTQISWQTYPINNDYEFIKKYLQLEINYNDILQNINKDKHINKAINTLPNIRILKQDFEQTLLSFILTSHKNIKAVRKCIRELSKKFGKTVIVDNKTYNLFPTIESLAHATEEELKLCGVGFRAKYLLEAAKKLLKYKNSNFNMFTLDEKNARDELLKFNGIGDKVADCILTFSLGHYTVTPLDLWGKRVLTDLYGISADLKYSDMREWYTKYFKEHTAWAGQFLFEYLRNNYIKLNS